MLNQKVNENKPQTIPELKKGIQKIIDNIGPDV